MGSVRVSTADSYSTLRVVDSSHELAHKLLGVCSVPDPFRIFEEKRQRYSAPPFGL